MSSAADSPAGLRGRALATWRRARCVELARAGQSYDDIARQVGYRHRSSAWRAVQAAMAEQTVEAAGALREEELARLEEVNAACWSRALAGDLDAAETVLRSIDLRVRLLGLAEPGWWRHRLGPRSNQAGNSGT